MAQGPRAVGGLSGGAGVRGAGHPQAPEAAAGPAGPAELADSAARRRAAARWQAREPVLAVLAAALGLHADSGEPVPAVGDEAVVTVLATVGDAVMELDAVRQRRDIEQAAFDNVWRGE